MNRTPTRTRRLATTALVLATSGALAFVSSSAFADDHATAESSSTIQAKLPAKPPAGKAWLQGVLTDQAGHPLDNVNVEVWPSSQSATEPVASNLTYAGTSARQQHGVYRVEVPMNEPYRIAFSAVGGQEDGDAFRTRWLGGGRPILARTAGRAGGGPEAVASGRVRNLGTTPLVHQGRVGSHAKAAKVRTRVGKKPTIRVRVSSYFVSSPTGKVVVRLKGHQVSRRLSTANHGTVKVRMPKVHRPGRYTASLKYQGSGTVKPSKGHAKVVVKRKR